MTIPRRFPSLFTEKEKEKKREVHSCIDCCFVFPGSSFNRRRRPLVVADRKLAIDRQGLTETDSQTERQRDRVRLNERLKDRETE